MATCGGSVHLECPAGEDHHLPGAHLAALAQLHRAVDRDLAGGDQLPTVRQLAVDLSINPNTVVRAYRELEIRGILTTQRVPSDQTVTITATVTIDGVTRSDSRIVPIIKQRETGAVYFSDYF